MAGRDMAQINVSRIPVAGIGGLGMVAGAGVIAFSLPAARGFLMAAAIGGLVFALALIAIRWRQGLPNSGPTLPLQGAPAGPDATANATWRDTDSDPSQLDRLQLSPRMN